MASFRVSKRLPISQVLSFPTEENKRFLKVEVAGIAKYFPAKPKRVGKLFLFTSYLLQIDYSSLGALAFK